MTPAVAQDDAIEEIVVTGYRASLMQAIDRKRNATGVVDAITAEDIGKFPDQNLAESLQRITGVSIDRFNNEGSRITVRGMGPEFNLVTLNGRSMPTAGGRSFDFLDLATEGIRAVEVYKTSNAALPTGGIGATVNIETARPFDLPGFRSVVSAKAVHETSSSDSDIADLDRFTPEIAALYSNTFADDRFGVLLSASYQERDNREENASVDNWGPNLQLDGGTVNDNNQRADGTWWHPQNVGYGFADISRDRINGQAVFQWAPTDRLTATLDYTYSELEFERDANSVGIWFECPNVEATVNERGSVVEVTQSCGDYSTNVARDHTIKENNSVGINFDWMATDNLTFSLDAHSSSSELRAGGLGDEEMSSANLIIGNTACPWCADAGADFGPATAAIDRQTAIYPTSGLPTFDVTFTGGPGGPNELLPSDIGSLFGQAFNNYTENTIDQVQLSGSWINEDEGAIRSIDFGYARTDQEFEVRNAYSGLLPAGFWLWSAQYWPDDAFDLRSFGGALDNFSNGGSYPVDFYYTANFDYLVNQYETVGGSDAIDPGVFWPGWGNPDFSNLTPEQATSADGTRGRFWSGPLGNNGVALVDESIDSFYTQVTIEDEFNGMPFNAVLGVRYEETELVSAGRENPAEAIIWVNGNEFSYRFAEEDALRQGLGENDFWLPAISMNLGVTDDVVVRGAYSRTIARPPIGNLTPNREFVGNPNVRNRRVNSGNPGLLPYVSDNFDLSVEYYYGEGSYASAGYFKKKVDNFLVSTTVQETFTGLTDPYIGADAELAREQLEDEGVQADDQAVFARINENLGNDPNTPVVARPDDPLAVFDVTTTENAEVGNLWGWELAATHMFGQSGFGVQANYTIVNGDVEADRNIIGQSFALPGLSDSGNLVVFYENDMFSGRLAYNWRDEFLSGFDQFGAPVYTEEYQQLDFNGTWYATDRMAVFLEAINITEEVQRVYVRYPEQFLRGNQYGARYNVGLRYNFD